ncbi:hypothetical protein NA57DRAFT_57937 [Rhizodiscina lignyota]|uniref:Beta-lactamase-related domain-containing protein n=1 Tax=Rhizodiscina lignyota TaxID=1504668 RepID=A0A9P4M504_9PEZI|nr:hypothetical protein NA57DRAFT_57937 [Rhizodiscina lignyota]
MSSSRPEASPLSREATIHRNISRLLSKRRGRPSKTSHLPPVEPASSVSSMKEMLASIDRDVIEEMLKTTGQRNAVCYAEMVDYEGNRTSNDGLPNEPLVAGPSPNGTIDENTLFGIGSVQKTIIATALGFIVEEPTTLARLKDDKAPKIQDIMKGEETWSEPAFLILNQLRGIRGKQTLEIPSRISPSLKELLVHVRAFSANQRYLFGPEGTIFMSDEVFERIMRDLGDKAGDTLGYNSSYSNWNYVVAGMIVQETMGTKTLSEALKILVLDELKMSCTVLDLDGFNTKKTGIAEAFIDTVELGCHRVDRPRYFQDTTELSVGGGYSCVEDLAKLLAFLTRKFLMEDWKEFFRLHGVGTDTFDYTSTTIGNYGLLDSPVMGMQSFDRTEQAPYLLGKEEKGSHYVISKAGAVKGYSCHYYIEPNEGIFVIVLTNSSGIIDMSNHIGQYMLQQMLKLKPRVDFVEKVRQIYASRRQFLIDSRNTEPRSDHNGFNLEELSRLAGVYEHRLSQQRIIIDMKNHEAEVYVDGQSPKHPKRTQELRMAWIREDTFSVYPVSGECTIDGYGAAWFGLEFEVQKTQGQISALLARSTSSAGTRDDVYHRIQ